MTGRAVVTLRDGRVYIGEAHLADGVLTMPEARRLERNLGGPRLYPPRPRAWAPRTWAEVRWVDEQAQVAA